MREAGTKPWAPDLVALKILAAPAQKTIRNLSELSGPSSSEHTFQASFAAPVEITAAVQPKMLWIASYYDAGAPAALFAADSPVASVEVSRA